jgi:hypothetical protein
MKLTNEKQSQSVVISDGSTEICFFFIAVHGAWHYDVVKTKDGGKT